MRFIPLSTSPSRSAAYRAMLSNHVSLDPPENNPKIRSDVSPSRFEHFESELRWPWLCNRSNLPKDTFDRCGVLDPLAKNVFFFFV